MAYSFPYSIVNLTSAGDRPTNGSPIHARHFNRLFLETVAVEAAIGVNPQGNKADLKTRLAQNLNDDGTYKKELVCEDDPSGNQRGTTRFFHAQINTITFNGPGIPGWQSEGFAQLPYTPFSEPPVVMWCFQMSGYLAELERSQIKAVSEVGVLFDARTNAGAGLNVTHNDTMVIVSISKSLRVWEEDVAWGLPPARTGT